MLGDCGKKRQCLLILKTPFQAWLAERVLQAENITNFDLLYIANQDAPEDLLMYQRLATKAKRSFYSVEKENKEKIKGKFKLLWFYLRQWGFLYKKFFLNKYEKILFSSLNNFVPQCLLGQHKTSLVVTFDDGAANYYKNGIYYKDSSSKTFAFFKKLLKCTPQALIKERIERHYSLHPELGNIVPPNKVKPIKGFEYSVSDNEGGIVYFIGQPLQSSLSSEQLARLRNYLETLKLDFYVKHPREKEDLLVDGVPLLDKKGHIAEEAILSHAGHKNIYLVGGFSTVLFNMPIPEKHKTMILLKDEKRFEEFYALAKQLGCQIVTI